MGFGIEETKYDPATLVRNRRVITLTSAVALAAVALAAMFTDWPARSALTIAALIVVVQACNWWMFASKKAGRITSASGWDDFKRIVGF